MIEILRDKGYVEISDAQIDEWIDAWNNIEIVLIEQHITDNDDLFETKLFQTLKLFIENGIPQE
jgi:hypothetical protein